MKKYFAELVGYVVLVLWRWQRCVCGKHIGLRVSPLLSDCRYWRWSIHWADFRLPRYPAVTFGVFSPRRSAPRCRHVCHRANSGAIIGAALILAIARGVPGGYICLGRRTGREWLRMHSPDLYGMQAALLRTDPDAFWC